MPPSKVAPAAMVLTAVKAVVPDGLGKVVWRLVFVVAETARRAREATRRSWVCIMKDFGLFNAKEGMILDPKLSDVAGE